jgi:hypothetical protein
MSSQGIISTIADGNSRGAYSGDNGPATRAKLNGPTDIESDANGNIYFIDSGNCRIRRIDTARHHHDCGRKRDMCL